MFKKSLMGVLSLCMIVALAVSCEKKVVKSKEKEETVVQASKTVDKEVAVQASKIIDDEVEKDEKDEKDEIVEDLTTSKSREIKKLEERLVNRIGLNKKLRQAELEDLSLMDLAILRNKIYARRGYDFSTKAYRDYFSKFNWYKPNEKSVEDKFTSIDFENIELIKWIERKLLVESSKIQDDEGRLEGISSTSIYIKNTSVNFKSKVDSNSEKMKIFLELNQLGEEKTIKYESDWNDIGEGNLITYVNGFQFEYNNDNVCWITTVEKGDDTSESVIYYYDFELKRIIEYDKIIHSNRNMLYCKNEYIYFMSADENEKIQVNRMYDFKKKAFYEIFDPELKKNLTYMCLNPAVVEADDNSWNGRVVSEEKFRFDIDYDNVLEEIFIKYEKPHGESESFIVTVKDGEKITEFTQKYMDDCETKLRFIPMKNKMYMSVLDWGPSDDPNELIFEYTGDEIKEVSSIRGDMIDFDIDGKITTSYDYVYGINFAYFDLNSMEHVIDPKIAIGKKTYVKFEMPLFDKSDYGFSIRWTYRTDSGHLKDCVVHMLQSYEEFEVIGFSRKYQTSAYNASVKIRTNKGVEGWILWKDGGD